MLCFFPEIIDALPVMPVLLSGFLIYLILNIGWQASIAYHWKKPLNLALLPIVSYIFT